MTENKDKLARLKAVRAGNRGVITKLSKEVEYILKLDDVDEGRLQTISGLLDEKLRVTRIWTHKWSIYANWMILKRKLRRPTMWYRVR